MSDGDEKKEFDYGSVPKDTAQFLLKQTEEIRSLMKRTTQDIIEVGQRLLEVKERLGHGQFLAWLEAEFDWTDRTARQFMSVARSFKSEIISTLEFTPTALYMLAAPSTPETVRQEAIAWAEAGKAISPKIVKEIKQRYYSSTPSTKKSLPSENVNQSDSLKSAGQTESARSKLEILAIRPAATDVFAGDELNKLDESQSKFSSHAQTGSWWQLGENHLLYCGAPNSVRFKERLPNPVALSIAFPPIQNWQLNATIEANSAVAFFTRYPDQDFELLQEAIERLLLLYTESEELIVFSYLPDPKILLLANQLDCRCYVAEPDLQRCEKIISTWKQHGLSVEKVNGLRF